MPASNSNLGGLAFAFHGANAFAFNGNNAFAFGGGGGGIDQYGFAGFPGNPMLVAGLTATRSAVLPALLPGANPPAATSFGDGPSDRGFPNKPLAFDHDPNVLRWGAAPRSALALLELLKGIDFDKPGGGELRLLARDSAGALQPLMAMTCPVMSYFLAQLWMIDRDAALRDTRLAEVLTQVTTPLSYFATVLNMQAERHPHTLLLIDAALKFAYAVGMRFKHTFAVPRPSDASALMQPMIEVPTHGAFPMGHATEGHVIAGLLSLLVPGLGPNSAAVLALRRNAYRIAHNRVIAGVHYPVDGLAGRLLGDALASYVAALGIGNNTAWTLGTFKASAVVSLPQAAMGEFDPPFCGAGCSSATGAVPPSSGIFNELWGRAAQEWA